MLMMPTKYKATLLLYTPLLATIIALAGCVRSEETRSISRSVELDQTDSVDVQLDMGAGELSVSGGSAKLVDADFQFNVPSWEPVVDYRNDGGRGVLHIRQPDASPSFGQTTNRWDLRLNDSVPISLAANLGASEATMTLGALTLKRVEIHQGVGELYLDLRGAPTENYDIEVNGGIGSATIRVPRSVGIVATVTGGLGSIDVEGLEKRGDEWRNAGHEDDPVTIHLNVKGGIGEVKISAEETLAPIARE
jgi:hypothetical protein